MTFRPFGRSLIDDSFMHGLVFNFTRPMSGAMLLLFSLEAVLFQKVIGSNSQ